MTGSDGDVDVKGSTGDVDVSAVSGSISSVVDVVDISSVVDSAEVICSVVILSVVVSAGETLCSVDSTSEVLDSVVGTVVDAVSNAVLNQNEKKITYNCALDSDYFVICACEYVTLLESSHFN